MGEDGYMTQNLIFCPVGIPVAFHENYDIDNHWRYTKGLTRHYETVVCERDGFVAEPNTYDRLIRGSGFKWDIVKAFLDTTDVSGYEYVGFWDDDLITDIQSVNRAIELAQQQGAKLFQLSTLEGSASTHQILHQQIGKKYSMTNMIEGMGPFIHTSLIPVLQEFWTHHRVQSGWGFDILLSPITKSRAMVVHEVSMFHPDKPSYYDKSTAFAEMDTVLTKVYPAFMAAKYGEIVGPYSDPQTEHEFAFNT
jgi:hypothetical protein